MPLETQDSSTENSTEHVTDRNLLIEQGRSFLQSSAVRFESENAKRTFLLEKGLREQEINTLLQERHQLPPVPPRTYPQPPPSNLPLYVALLLRSTMWAAGIIGTLSFLYKTFLLERIIRSLSARHQLILHQRDLMGNLQTHIQTLKDEQNAAYKSLRPVVFGSSHINALEEIPITAEGSPSLSIDKIIWIVLNDGSSTSSTVDAIAERLEKAFPDWSQAQDRKLFKQMILQELETSSFYSKAEEQDTEVWSLSDELRSNPPLNPVRSLNKLRDAVGAGYKSENIYQYVFKSLTDFTAFLSRETFQFYTTGGAAFRRNFGDSNLSPIQEDIRKEIRALKGLVLNRRSFTPTPVRSPSLTTIKDTTA